MLLTTHSTNMKICRQLMHEYQHTSHQQLHLTASFLYHVREVWTPLPKPPTMFIAQKIISLVISAPLWAAINFSSLHDGPACGHRSLTFSKRSINLSVHPATYPLMFSSSPVVFFSLLSGCWLLGGKLSLSLCALQDIVGVLFDAIIPV